MSDKVGARFRLWAYVIIPCVMLLLLACGCVILLSGASQASDLILIFLVILPMVVLVSLFITRIYQMTLEDKMKRAEEASQELPALFSMGEVRSIEIYGPEFGVPYYKQLTMPNFVGKPKAKKRKSKQNNSATPRASNKPTYADYVDDYNQVKQSLMNFDEWSDALSNEPEEIERSLAESTKGKRPRSKSKKKTTELKPDVVEERIEPKIEAEPPAPITEPVVATTMEQKTKTKARQKSTAKVEHIPAAEAQPRPSASRKTTTQKAARQSFAIKTHKSVPRPHYDDYVETKASYTANDRLLSTKLREKFVPNTTINAKSELLNKMRQENNILEKK